MALHFFLRAWALTGPALGLAVLVLHWTYRLLGSDFGTSGFLRETVTVLLTSAMQAGIAAGGAWMVSGFQTGGGEFYAIGIVAGLATAAVYALTHRGDMEGQEILILVTTQTVVVGVMLFALA